MRLIPDAAWDAAPGGTSSKKIDGLPRLRAALVRPPLIFPSVCTSVLGEGQGLHVQPTFNWKERAMERNSIITGDAVQVLKTVTEGTIDLVVTDPTYLVNYRDRSGRSLQNDDNPDGVLPVFAPMACAMKANSYAICFAGWSALPQFSAAWDAAGLRIVSLIVWEKQYAASRQGYTQHRHESSYVLAKGQSGKASTASQPARAVMHHAPCASDVDRHETRP